MLVQHARAPEQAQEDPPQRKINVTSKSPVGDISVVTLIRILHLVIAKRQRRYEDLFPSFDIMDKPGTAMVLATLRFCRADKILVT